MRGLPHLDLAYLQSQGRCGFPQSGRVGLLRNIYYADRICSGLLMRNISFCDRLVIWTQEVLAFSDEVSHSKPTYPPPSNTTEATISKRRGHFIFRLKAGGCGDTATSRLFPLSEPHIPIYLVGSMRFNSPPGAGNAFLNSPFSNPAGRRAEMPAAFS